MEPVNIRAAERNGSQPAIIPQVTDNAVKVTTTTRIISKQTYGKIMESDEQIKGNL